MSDEHDDEEKVTITLELPAELAADLEELRKQFGEELLVDIVRAANKQVEARLALRGAYIKERK